MYTKAKYTSDEVTGSNSNINVDINGVTSFVPLDPANRDYAAIMQLVADGKLTIAPADEPPAPAASK
jgi:hypothetical protein